MPKRYRIARIDRPDLPVPQAQKITALHRVELSGGWDAAAPRRQTEDRSELAYIRLVGIVLNMPVGAPSIGSMEEGSSALSTAF